MGTNEEHTRYGAVIVFKKDLNRSTMRDALHKIGAYIDMDYFVAERPRDLIESFDERDGGPVWYLP